MTHCNEELQLLQQKLARKRRLEKMLKDLYNQRTELQSKVRELAAVEGNIRQYEEHIKISREDIV